ncbi:MAG: protease modulator HflC [Deltaproteobacteria bacterium]|nr:protease modulator HflC [Deltaproteobacteria bacterium]MBW2069925.1 protease modulator HflC [Deltaproteobacteria bacterium]
MKGKGLQIVLALVVVVAVVAASSFYVLNEGEQAVITQFGKPVAKPITQAGLHWKMPFVQKINRFEKRILKWDGSPNQIPTKDKKLIWVDTTARWRIADPLLFLTRVRDRTTALSRLDGIIDSVVRDTVSDNNLIDLIRSEGWETVEKTSGIPGSEMAREAGKAGVGREVLMRQMRTAAAKLTPEFGIELIDVRIKRINYVESVLKKVYDRMISERRRIAARYRSEGEGEAARIKGEMQKELKRISSEAYRKAQEVRGKADAEATKIYGEVYNKDPEFYSYSKTLELYRSGSSKNTRLILTTDSDFYKYIKEMPQ